MNHLGLLCRVGLPVWIDISRKCEKNGTNLVSKYISMTELFQRKEPLCICQRYFERLCLKMNQI